MGRPRVRERHRCFAEPPGGVPSAPRRHPTHAACSALPCPCRVQYPTHAPVPRVGRVQPALAAPKDLGQARVVGSERRRPRAAAALGRHRQQALVGKGGVERKALTEVSRPARELRPTLCRPVHSLLQTAKLPGTQAAPPHSPRSTAQHSSTARTWMSSTERKASAHSSSSHADRSCSNRVSRYISHDAGMERSVRSRLAWSRYLIRLLRWLRRMSHSRRNSVARLWVMQNLKARAAACA